MEIKTQEELNQDLISAVKRGNIENAISLLEMGADLFVKTLGGNNLLYVAATRRKREMFDWLLNVEKNGKKIDINELNNGGNSLLLNLVKEDEANYYVEKILSLGANPNIVNYSDMSPLIQAVSDSKLDIVEILLKDPSIDVNYQMKDSKINALLMATTVLRDVNTQKICENLINHGINLKAVDADGKNALINVLFKSEQFMKEKEKKAHLEFCKFLINQNFDLNYASPSGMTAFWLASRNKSLELADLLLDKGVNPNVKYSIDVEANSDKYALTNLINNMKSEEDLRVVEKAIALGAKINQKDDDGNTPATYGFVKPQTAPLMIELGADVNTILRIKVKDKIKKIPVISQVIDFGVEMNNLVKEMIRNGAKVSFKEDFELQKYEPMSLAIMDRNEELVEILLETKQIDPNMILYKGTEEETCFLELLNSSFVSKRIASFFKEEEMLKNIIKGKETNDVNNVKSNLLTDEEFDKITKRLEEIKLIIEDLINKRDHIFSQLLKHGADVNIRLNNGNTPLFNAVTKSDVDLFVKHGADLFAKNNNGENVLINVIKNNNPIAPYIFKKYKKADDPTIKNLYYQLAFIENPNSYQRESITMGIYSIQNAEVKEAILTKEEISVVDNIDYQDESGNTPLLIASAMDNAYLIKVYLELGGDLNKPNNNGETPIMHAIANNNHKLVDFMIKNGADLNAQTKNGKTVVEFAEEGENKEIIEAIGVERGLFKEGQLTGYKKYKSNIS